MKKIVAIAMVATLTLGMSVTTFAATPGQFRGQGRGANCGGRIASGTWNDFRYEEGSFDCFGFRYAESNFDGLGLGQGGPGRGLGPGGRMLRDGSCFVVQP